MVAVDIDVDVGYKVEVEPEIEVEAEVQARGLASLQKLDDGQSDNVVTLRRRRIAEEEAAAVKTGRPPWDGSPMKGTPAALKGCACPN